jgi:hypothetical protein
MYIYPYHIPHPESAAYRSAPLLCDSCFIFLFYLSFHCHPPFPGNKINILPDSNNNESSIPKGDELGKFRFSFFNDIQRRFVGWLSLKPLTDFLFKKKKKIPCA